MPCVMAGIPSRTNPRGDERSHAPVRSTLSPDQQRYVVRAAVRVYDETFGAGEPARRRSLSLERIPSY